MIDSDLSKDLIKKGYPEEIFSYDIEKEEREVQECLNYDVFDIDKGLLLLLADDNEVLGALSGRK